MAVTNMYNEKMSYDKNGNIMAMSRNGDYDAQTAPITIDELSYAYDAGNKLQWVQELSNNNGALGFVDGVYANANTTINPDYTYDANGNMTLDRNKNITSIKYNHLNLPTEIIFNNTANTKITYLYDAVGTKVQKTLTQGTLLTLTDYLGGYQYLKDGTLAVVLQFFPHAEGYVNFSNNVYKYVFNYTDHLGNVRVSYTKQATTGLPVILEQNHYYPFGLKHTKYNIGIMKLRGNDLVAVVANPYKYKYNGKELQDELGLNWYDFGGRQYMQDIGRTTTIDPMAEKFYDLSPQSFLNNNPLRFIDPTRMMAIENEFEPTKEGNLKVEKGDTPEKLKQQYGVVVTDKNFEFKEGNIITLDNNVTRAIDRSNGGTVDEINSGEAKFDVKNDNYVCDQGAQMANAGVEITPKNAEQYGQFPDPMKFDSTPGYSEVKNLNGIKNGEGIISIGGQHTVSYYGTSNNGTVSVFTKNGREASPTVAPLNQVINDFNKNQGTNFTTKDVKYFKQD